MGSYNQTCAITHCPILPEQEVRVFYLVLNIGMNNIKEEKTQLKQFPYMGSYCYPYDQFKIIGYPLLAKYNDYGRFIHNDNELANITLNNINKIYIPNNETIINLEDYLDEKDLFLDVHTINDINLLDDMINKGALRVKTPYSMSNDKNGTSFISRMVILESVYQNIIKKQRNINFSMFFEELKDSLELSDNFFSFDHKQKDIPYPMHVSMYKKFFNLIYDYDNPRSQLIIKNKIRRCSLKTVNESVNFYNDYKKVEDKHVFCESVASLYFCEEWFKNYSFEFKPMLTTNDFIDYLELEENYIKLADETFKHISKCKYHYNDEDIPLNLKISFKYELSVFDLKAKRDEWFNKQDNEYKIFSDMIDYLVDNKIESFIIGDLSKMDNFISEFHLLNDLSHGTFVYLKY